MGQSTIKGKDWVNRKGSSAKGETCSLIVFVVGIVDVFVVGIADVLLLVSLMFFVVGIVDVFVVGITLGKIILRTKKEQRKGNHCISDNKENKKQK